MFLAAIFAWCKRCIATRQASACCVPRPAVNGLLLSRQWPLRQQGHQPLTYNVAEVQLFISPDEYCTLRERIYSTEFGPIALYHRLTAPPHEMSDEHNGTCGNRSMKP